MAFLVSLSLFLLSLCSPFASFDTFSFRLVLLLLSLPSHRLCCLHLFPLSIPSTFLSPVISPPFPCALLWPVISCFRSVWRWHIGVRESGLSVLWLYVGKYGLNLRWEYLARTWVAWLFLLDSRGCGRLALSVSCHKLMPHTHAPVGVMYLSLTSPPFPPSLAPFPSFFCHDDIFSQQHGMPSWQVPLQQPPSRANDHKNKEQRSEQTPLLPQLTPHSSIQPFYPESKLTSARDLTHGRNDRQPARRRSARLAARLSSSGLRTGAAWCLVVLL